MGEKLFGKIEQTPVNKDSKPTLKELVDSAEKIDGKNKGEGTVVIENLGDEKVRAKLTSEKVREKDVENPEKV